MAITISGNGIVEANLADNAVTLAKMASGTDGEILTYDASGNPTAVSVGTDGQVLTSTGAGSPPAFETAAGGGKVLQVITSTSSTTEVAITSDSWVELPGSSVTITPSSTTSRILYSYNTGGIQKNGNYMRIKIDRSGTQVKYHTQYIYNNNGDNVTWMPGAINSEYIDSPATISSITYKVYGKCAGTEWRANPNGGTNSATAYAMEIGA